MVALASFSEKEFCRILLLLCPEIFFSDVFCAQAVTVSPISNTPASIIFFMDVFHTMHKTVARTQDNDEVLILKEG